MPASRDHQPRELPDQWVLPFTDGTVTQLQIDFGFGLTVEGGPSVSQSDLGWDSTGRGAASEI